MRSILVPPTSRIANLKRYTPKFSGAPQYLTWCQPFGVQVLPKSGWPGFPGQRVYSYHHILKGIVPAVNLAYLDTLYGPAPSDFL